jgi:hypothetical protein
MRGIESIIKYVADKYSISYENNLTMFYTDKDDNVFLTPDCIKKLGDPKKQSIYKKLYVKYRIFRHSYFHWAKIKINAKIDTTEILSDETKASEIITDILELINIACNIL